MAMFPNATKGYMPFVSGQKRLVPAKKHGLSNPKIKKTYQVTLKDKQGRTFTYIVKTDGTKSLPTLCENMIGKLGSTDSLPNIGLSTPKRKSFDLKDLRDQVESEKKQGQGIFSSFLNFLKEKTGKNKKSKSGKSKRKAKPLEQRKRKRTVSAMSNLDPIQESPDEDDYADDDNDSYAHDSSSMSDSELSENISFSDFNINGLSTQNSEKVNTGEES